MGQVLPFYLEQDIGLCNDLLGLDDANNSCLVRKINKVNIDVWKNVLLDY